METQSLSWPRAPLHRLSENGTYIVTAATYRKQHHFRGAQVKSLYLFKLDQVRVLDDYSVAEDW